VTWPRPSPPYFSFRCIRRCNVRRARDAPAQLVDALVEAERLLPVAAVWNDRLGSVLVQLLAQFVAVVSRVAKHMLRRLHPADQALGDRIVVRFASGQQNGDQAPLSICECVNLRVAPSARAANSLLLLPLFRLLPNGVL
jgi:hypothetical protein